MSTLSIRFKGVELFGGAAASTAGSVATASPSLIFISTTLGTWNCAIEKFASVSLSSSVKL